jgi:hypothetical protein
MLLYYLVSCLDEGCTKAGVLTTPASDHRCVVSVPGPSTWGLWLIQWHRDWFSFQFVSHLPVSIIPPLLRTLPEYCCHQKDKAKESSNLQTKECSFVYRGAMDRKVL